VIVRDGLMENAVRMGEHLRSRLGDIQEGSAILGDVRGVGLLNAVEMVADKNTKQSLPAGIAVNGRIVKAARALGLLIYARPSAGGNGDWLMMAPPLNVTESEVDEICGLFGQALQTVESGLRREGVLS
jgi:4-aminobutyrate aminotransferase-like enzyme